MRIGGSRRGTDQPRSQGLVHVTPVFIVLAAPAACGCDPNGKSKDTTQTRSTHSVSGAMAEVRRWGS
jgi:hypothetical protein